MKMSKYFLIRASLNDPKRRVGKQGPTNCAYNEINMYILNCEFPLNTLFQILSGLEFCNLTYYFHYELKNCWMEDWKQQFFCFILQFKCFGRTLPRIHDASSMFLPQTTYNSDHHSLIHFIAC